MGLSALAYPSAPQISATGGAWAAVQKNLSNPGDVMCGSGDRQPYPTTLAAAKARETAYLEERQLAETALLTRLSQHPSSQARAVALYLKSHPSYTDEPQLGEVASLAHKACYGSGSKKLNTPECDAATADAATVRGKIAAKYLPAAHELALLASRSDDPQVYGLAINACKWHTDMKLDPGAACSQLSLQRWAQLDPNDMAPWLAMAAEARDTNAWSDAVTRAARASHSRHLPGLISQWLHAVVAPGEDVMEISVASAMAAKRESGFYLLADFRPSMARCSGQEIGDANRRQLCDSLAQTMTETSSDLFARRMGARMGERLGWPKEKTAQMIAESGALLAQMSQIQVDAMVAASGMPMLVDECSSVANRQLAVSARAQQVGQMAAIKESIAASGRSLEAVVAEYTAEQTKREQQAKSKGTKR